MKKFVMCVLVGGAAVLAPNVVRACACGCGVFDVGTSSMLPHDAGGMAFIAFDFQDQNRNWSGTAQAPSVNNGDKDIRTDFSTYGLQYMFNRSWGAQVEVPYDFRDFKTLGGANGHQIASVKWSGFGDVRVEGVFTGFSEDMSSGLTFGVKLPTGSYSHNDAYNDIDRDSELGTGGTDFLVGGFHQHHLVAGWTWFAQGILDVPMLIQARYRAGTELDAATGVYYKGWSMGAVRFTPLAQVIVSERTSDSGAAASYDTSGKPQSGYQRILLSPGVEIDVRRFSVYADVEVPVYQDFVGNQLAAPWLFKMYVMYRF